MNRAPLLDTVTVVETPEGVVLRLLPAGPIPRALAQATDLLLLGMFQSMLWGVLALAKDLGFGIMLIIGFCMQWLYPVLCEVLWGGQTIGKRMLGLVVVHDDGSPIRLQASAVRNLLLVVEVALGAVLAYVCMLSTRRFQRLGDLAAGSMVVHQHIGVQRLPARAATTTGPQATQINVEPLPVLVPQALSQAEQKLLVAFAERAPRLSSERASELASLLQPLHGKTGRAAVDAVQGMSAGILGST